MSGPASIPVTAPAPGWGLRWRQTLAVVRLELVRGLARWRSLWLVLLAFAPIPVIVLHALNPGGRRCSLQQDAMVLGGIVEMFYLRFAVFFACLGIAMRLIRGEVVQRSLHYPFLAPLRRELLVLGKFLAGSLTAVVFFGAGVLASCLLVYGHFDAGRAFLRDGAGLTHVGSYLLVTGLACVGYSAVFLALALVFRNPVIPALVLSFWEAVNLVLPVWLKKLSVIFYLEPLLPGGSLPRRGLAAVFSVVAEPTPAWVAVSGLLVFSGAVLVYACFRIRRFEISYAAD